MEKHQSKSSGRTERNPTSIADLESLSDFSDERPTSAISVSSNDSSVPSQTSSEDFSDVTHSNSNTEEMRVVAMHVDWTIGYEKPSIFGHVVLDIEQLNPNSTNLILDFASLNILFVQDSATRKQLFYEEKKHSTPDSALSIDLTESLNKSRKCTIDIMYSKTDSIGINCNEHYQKDFEDNESQTYPLMYSQFDYFRGRRLFPCQDTPDNQIQFSASAHIDKNLQMLMSAKLIKTEQQSSTTNTLHFVNPHPIPVYAIGFVLGKFLIYDIDENVKIYSEETISDKYMTQLKQIPTYLKLLDQTVGKDPWREHHFALVLKGTQTFTYPYLYIFPKTVLQPHVIIHSLCYNWFRNVITIRNIDVMWLNEAFPAYVSGRISTQAGYHVEGEKKVCAAVDSVQWGNDSLDFNAKLYSDPDALKTIIEKAHLCFLVLEHYGGKYGEFESFVRAYYEKFKFKYVSVETFSQLARKCLVFRDKVDPITNIETWLQNGARTPDEFLSKVTCDYNVEDTIKWLLADRRYENMNTKGELLHGDKKCTSKFLFLTPDNVNHRERKLVLLRKLFSYSAKETSSLTKNKRNRLKKRTFYALEEHLGLNCALDETVKYEFVKLSIANQICVQLKRIKHFVANSTDSGQLTDIMHGMLLWQQASNKNMDAEDYEYTSKRREIIQLCDSRLEQLLNSERAQYMTK